MAATTQLRVFVSHSHEDDAFCRQIVTALRDAGADVWYDEHNLGSGVLRREIMHELSTRPVVLVVLSRAAFASSWVQDECEWAYNLNRRKPARLILPVTGAPYEPDDFDTLLYLEAMKRIEAPDQKPLSPATAINRLLRALALTPAGASPAPIAPQPSESADDLLTRGKALVAQQQYAEALPLFERATQLAPGSFDAWNNMGNALSNLGRYMGAIAAYDRAQAQALDDQQAWVWYNKGVALSNLGQYQEALTACDRALALDANDADTWSNKGVILAKLGHYQEALAAYDRAFVLDDKQARVWYNQGVALGGLKRYQEEVVAYDRALTLDANDADTWNNRGAALANLGRHEEALAVYDHALALDANYVKAWKNMAISLRALGRTAEAAAATKRAKELRGEG